MSDDQFDHHGARESRRRDVQVVVEVYRRLSADIERRFDTVNRNLRSMSRRLQNQMENIMSNQEHLDAAVATLGVQLAEVVAEIDALKAQPEAEALDFTGLDAAVQAVSDVVPDEDPSPDHDPDPDGEPDPEPQPA